MKFSVLLLAAFCSASYALELLEGLGEVSGFDPAIAAGRRVQKFSDVVTSTTKVITQPYKTKVYETVTVTKEHKTVTKTKENVVKTDSTFTTVVKYTTRVPVAKTSTSSAPTLVITPIVTPTSFPSCQATLRPAPKAECGSLAMVLHPAMGNPYTIKEVSLGSCQNACVCGEKKSDCMAFAWDNDTTGSTYGTCTLYDKTLEQMGTMTKNGQNQILYDRACFHRGDASTSSMPTMTMGALKLAPVGKRAQLDDRIVGVLAGI